MSRAEQRRGAFPAGKVVILSGFLFGALALTGWWAAAARNALWGISLLFAVVVGYSSNWSP